VLAMVSRGLGPRTSLLTLTRGESDIERPRVTVPPNWDAAYTPLLECHDRDQPRQRGGWLHARYGKGHYSYVAYAFDRRLPSGVPGVYRLLANLLSLGRR
jgi:hypothetical protein